MSIERDRRKILQRRVDWLVEKIAVRKANELPHDFFEQERAALVWLIEERENDGEGERFLAMLVAATHRSPLWEQVPEDLRRGIDAYIQRNNPNYVPEPERLALKAKNIEKEKQKHDIAKKRKKAQESIPVIRTPARGVSSGLTASLENIVRAQTASRKKA